MTVLAHDIVTGGAAHGAAFVLVHGILGNKNNWRSIANKLVARRPDVRCVLVDLRRHGDSHDDSLTVANDTVRGAAHDLADTLAHLRVTPHALVGHSWGGKAVLDAATQRLIACDHAVVIDSPPGLRTGLSDATGGSGADDVERVIDAVSSLPRGLARDRAHLVEQLRAVGLSLPLAQWMTTNLTPLPAPLPDGRAFAFKFDIDGVRRMLADFVRVDLWPAVFAHDAPPTLHMVRGGRSNRWTVDENERLAEATARGVMRDVVVPDAGHWVHTDDPDAVLEVLQRI